MRVISKKTLRDFYAQPLHQSSKVALEAWYHDTAKANWSSPQDIKNVYRNVSFVANDRVIFNICGNKYRLVVAINYNFKLVFIKFIGTHKQYDKIDAATVGGKNAN